MIRTYVFFITGAVLLSAPSVGLAQQTSWGSVLKSAGQVAIQQMSPPAQATIDQAKRLGAGASQENFLVTKAKEFMVSGNYQPALDLANYVITALNSKSIDAKKIMADAKAALTKIAQDKLIQSQQKALATGQTGQAQVNAVQQIKADASQAVKGVKGLFGTQK